MGRFEDAAGKVGRSVMQEHQIDIGPVRKLWIGETGAYRDHLLRLDPESRRNRFGGGVSDDYIRGYVEASREREGVLHGFFVRGILRGVAELRPRGRVFADEAEAAFSIEKPWQGLGLGTVLLQRTLLAARDRGVRRLHMAWLADNRRMQQLALKFDAELTGEFDSVAALLDVRAAFCEPRGANAVLHAGLWQTASTLCPSGSITKAP